MTEDKNFNELYEKCEKYFNTLVIDDFKVVLLTGLHNEPKDDYYYIFYDGDDPYLCSMVAPVIFLVDNLDKEQYTKLVNLWNKRFNKQGA